MNNAMKAARERPLVQKKSITTSQGPRDALSKISKSHIALDL